mmetsp:Transcript_48360/g.146069  ORF Transcript_48360/g.146069 Transcript_48360/m.146069 type:complete len:249 (-) Transcript_48360:720-1466(-)
MSESTLNIFIILLIISIAVVSIVPLFALSSTVVYLPGEESRLFGSTLPVEGGFEGPDPEEVNIINDVPLIVGGTDGSGTRSVVCLLDALGVPMVIDDERTLDVEARELGFLEIVDHSEPSGRRKIRGWPAVVRQVLARTRSADYDPSELPEELHANLNGRLSKLLSAVLRRGKKSRELTGNRASKGVSWGLKAPVSMLLLPMIHDFKGVSKFRFLHVVRDGRDIAYSGNQVGPIEIFLPAFASCFIQT